MGIFISLPVSLILLWLILRPKKDDPFPTGGFMRLVIAGAVCTIVSSALSLILAFVYFVIRVGPETVSQLVELLRTDPQSVPAFLESINAGSRFLPLLALAKSFITVGLLEELAKYLAGRWAIRKGDMVRTWMDSVICFAVVGLTFEVLENILYAQQTDVITAVIRNLTPIHFCCCVIMGWFFGRALVKEEKVYRWAAVLFPAMIHTFYDTALLLMGSAAVAEDTGDVGLEYGLLGIVAFVGAFFLTVIVIVKIVRWQKKGTLAVPVTEEPEEMAA